MFKVLAHCDRVRRHRAVRALLLISCSAAAAGIVGASDVRSGDRGADIGITGVACGVSAGDLAAGRVIGIGLRGCGRGRGSPASDSRFMALMMIPFAPRSASTACGALLGEKQRPCSPLIHDPGDIARDPDRNRRAPQP